MAYKNKNKGFDKKPERFDPVGSDRYRETSALSQKPEEGSYGSPLPGEYKQMVSPIIVKADPYSEGSTVGEPYAITNRPNKVIDVSYSGKANTAGNVLPQLRSRLDAGNKLMKRFDAGRLGLSLNYLYLAMLDTDANVMNNYQMEESFEEALSILSAEVLTQITGLNYQYNESGTTFPHTPGNNALFGASILYQSILQNLNSVIIGYNKIIANEKTILDMSFNTTTTQVLELFNLLKKSTFTGKLKAISDMIIGEYFDLNWARHSNLLQVGVSQKSQSFTDPTLEILGTHRLPVVDIGISVADVYSSVIKTTKFVADYGGGSKTLPQLVRAFLEKVSITSVLEWARRTVFDDDYTISAKAYFNDLDALTDAIRLSLKTFKADFSGVRTVFDVLSKSGMMYWSKKVNAQVVTKPGSIIEPVRNRLVDDVFKSLVGMKSISLDPTSYKFRYYTIWDKYDGIAKFDNLSGGSFIQFSAKTVDNLPDGDRNPARLIPLLYIPDSVIVALNRLGETVNITHVNLPSGLAETTTWPVLKLNPLSIDIPIRLAKVELPVTGFDSHKMSHLQDFLMDVFGLAFLVKTGASPAYQFLVKPSYIAYIDVEIDNQSEAMLDFCRTYSPFRLQSPNQARTIGFKLGGYEG